MNLEIDINDLGKPCINISTNNKIKYIYGKEMDDILKEIAKVKYENVKIINNVITFNIEKTQITINNYRQNKNKDINKIIETTKQIKLKERNKRLKNKKISRRNKLVTGILVFSLATATLFSTTNATNLNDKVNDTNDQFVYVQNVSINNELNNEMKTQNFDFETYDRTNTNKYKNTKQNYFENISKISNEYGIDPQIILAIATQERGVHSSIRDAYAIGLMQIELSVWDNQNITAFNYKTNSFETVHITEKKLGDLNFNIKIGCMIFQQSLKESNYNLPLAIQAYNYGPGNINKLLNYCKSDNNLKKEDILNDENCNWMNYRELIEAGDNEYLEHITSYIENKESLICNVDENTKINYCIKNKIKENTKV